MNRKFFVLGAGKAGASAAEFLLGRGAEVSVYDEGEPPDLARLVSAGAEKIERGRRFDYLASSDVVVVSPGIKPDHELLLRAAREGKKIVGELEIGFSAARSPFLAVTGTNGKTTVTELISHILTEAGLFNILCGNNDTPVTSAAERLMPDVFAVAEVSSFMLEHIETFRPRIAALLNLTPDHLNHHKDMADYTAAKFNIFANQKRGDYAVVNESAPAPAKLRSEVIRFSADKPCGGAYVKAGDIYFKGGAVCRLPERFAARHETENALAAVAFAKILQIEDADIARSLDTFTRSAHRVEFVAKIAGVSFYDDSKGTNIDAALAALNSLSGDTAVILGGSDKGYSYAPLFKNLPSNTIFAAFTGAVTDKLAEGARAAGFTNYAVCQSLADAVNICFSHMKKSGGNVLLSPASASFDAFKNYAERGEKFKSIVKELGE